MKINPSLIWNMVGDGFGRAFDIQQKRSVEALWQGMFDLAKDAVSYTDHVANLQNPFTASVFAPWGKILVYPSLVDSTDYYESFVVGSDKIWSNFDIPSTGFLRWGNMSIEYRVLSYRDAMGGKLYTIQYVGPSAAPLTSSSFNSVSEFDNLGSVTPDDSGDEFSASVDWVNWLILFQKKKVSPLSNWKQKWMTRITNWDGGATTKRSVAINSIGDIGVNYELRLEDDGTSAYVSFGTRAVTRYVPLFFSANSITRTVGSFIDDGFREGQVLNVENSANTGTRTIIYASAKSLIVDGSAFVNESTVVAVLRTSLTTVSTPLSNNWRNALRISSESNPASVDFEVSYDASTSSISGAVWVNGVAVSHNAMKVKACERYNGIDVFNQRNNISIILDGVFLEEGMMADGNRPDLTTIGESYSFVYNIDQPIVNCSRIQIDAWDMNIDAEIMDISSDYLRIEVDERFYGYYPEVITIGDSVLLLTDSNDSGADYELKIGDISSLNIGQVITIKPWNTYDFKFINDSTFATKYPIYSDAVFLSGAQAREVDLYSRFGKLLLLHPEEDSEQYLSLIRGAQYMRMSPPNYQNIQNGIAMMGGAPFAKFEGVLSSSRAITDSLGGVIGYQATVGDNVINYDPYWNNFLKVQGSKIETLQSIIKDTVRVYDWKNGFSLLLDRVPAWQIYGTALIIINDSLGFNSESSGDLIKVIRRSIPKDVDFVLEYESNRSEPLFDQNKNKFHQEIDYSCENIATVVDDLGFPDYGEVVQNSLDYQTVNGNKYSEEYQFESPLKLDSGASLDETRTLNSDWYRFITRRVESKKNGIYDMPKGYSLLWMYEGETSNLVTYDSGRWYEVFSGSDTFSDCYIEESGLMYACMSTTSSIVESEDGFNWTTKAVSGATGIAQRVKKGWGFGYSSGVLQKRDGSGNWSEISVPAITGTPQALDVVGDNVYVFWGIGTNIYMIKSTDGGSTWGTPTSIYSLGINAPVSVKFFDADHAILTTNADGILHTYNGGATWIQYLSATAMTRGGNVSDTKFFVGEDLSSDYFIVTNYKLAGLGISGATSIGIAGSIAQFSGGDRYGFVLISGDVYRATDDGVTWSSAMTGISGTVNALGVSENGLNRLAVGDKIWKWF